MNTAIIMLGSNTNAKINLELALNKLIKSFEIITKGLQVKTEPYGAQFTSNFQNLALKLLSKESKEETTAIFKQIERELGRKSESKTTGIIPIDIDLIFWNDHLVHEDYNRFEYVKNCINEIRH